MALGTALRKIRPVGNISSVRTSSEKVTNILKGHTQALTRQLGWQTKVTHKRLQKFATFRDRRVDQKHLVLP